ncbi:MAG: HAMP domain-containing sensor histidine kinase [Elusimicrobia bacterium]|nr:HAMP domain-containing sensor histidine kinase [Elusimicrobiota bacterium]
MKRVLEKRQLSEELGREKIMRAELEAAYHELQKVERLKEGILGRVHHELRAPIAVALLAAESLGEESLSEKGRGLVKLVRRRIGDLQEQIEEILLYAKLQESEVGVELSEVDLKRLLETLVARLQPNFREKNLAVEISCDPSLGPLLLDAGLMENACKHLLLNAAKFSGGDGRVLIAVQRKEAKVLISFTDHGIGIPEDQLPKLSDAFYQVAECLTREVGGLGLGLAIVRRIAESHGGSISVTSRLGEGSTFTLVLPLKAAPPKPR